MVSITVLGVHPVSASDFPCCLVEIVVDGCVGPDLDTTFIQESEAPKEWQDQAGWMFSRLNSDGTQGKPWSDPWASRERFRFFLHFYDVKRPLRSAYGLVHLLEPTPMPDRLLVACPYEPPD